MLWGEMLGTVPCLFFGFAASVRESLSVSACCQISGLVKHSNRNSEACRHTKAFPERSCKPRNTHEEPSLHHCAQLVIACACTPALRDPNPEA